MVQKKWKFFKQKIFCSRSAFIQFTNFKNFQLSLNLSFTSISNSSHRDIFKFHVFWWPDFLCNKAFFNFISDKTSSNIWKRNLVWEFLLYKVVGNLTLVKLGYVFWAVWKGDSTRCLLLVLKYNYNAQYKLCKTSSIEWDWIKMQDSSGYHLTGVILFVNKNRSHSQVSKHTQYYSSGITYESHMSQFFCQVCRSTAFSKFICDKISTDTSILSENVYSTLFSKDVIYSTKETLLCNGVSAISI